MNRYKISLGYKPEKRIKIEDVPQKEAPKEPTPEEIMRSMPIMAIPSYMPPPEEPRLIITMPSGMQVGIPRHALSFPGEPSYAVGDGASFRITVPRAVRDALIQEMNPQGTYMEATPHYGSPLMERMAADRFLRENQRRAVEENEYDLRRRRRYAELHQPPF